MTARAPVLFFSLLLAAPAHTRTDCVGGDFRPRNPASAARTFEFDSAAAASFRRAAFGARARSLATGGDRDTQSSRRA